MFDLNNYGIREKCDNELPAGPYCEEEEADKEGPTWSKLINNDKLKREYNKDKKTKILANHAKTDKAVKIKKRYYIKNGNGILFRLNKHHEFVIYIPRGMRNDVMNYFHTGNTFNHQGIHKMYDTMVKYVIWSGMDKDIKKFCGTCDSCHASKTKYKKYAEGKIKIFPAKKPFQQIAMDIVGPLPVTTEGNRYLLTIIDRFTRFVTAVPIKEVSAVNIAKTFINNWVYLYGPPKEILTDNGTQFASNIFKNISKLLNVKQLFTTPYHPECNGMIERFHKYLKERLKFKAIDKRLDYFSGDDWDIHIPNICHAYNISTHTTTKYAPYELVFGRRPELPLILAELNQEYLEEEVKDYDQYLETLIKQLNLIRGKAKKLNLKNVQRAISRINKNRGTFPFKEGELVMKYVGNGMVGTKKKLREEWDGPYEIFKVCENGVDFIIRDTRKEDEKQTIHGKWIAYYQKWKEVQLKSTLQKFLYHKLPKTNKHPDVTKTN